MLKQLFYDCRWWLEARYSVRLWDGRLPLPHALKQAVVRGYLRSHNLRAFVETGTYRGDMAAAMRWRCDEVHTVELHPTLAAQARRRFRYWRRVHVYEGDSAAMLPSILESLSQPALLWLDAHFTDKGTAGGDTRSPLEQELAVVLEDPLAKVVLVDDARDLGVDGHLSVEALEKLVARAGRTMEIGADIVRIS